MIKDMSLLATVSDTGHNTNYNITTQQLDIFHNNSSPSSSSVSTSSILEHVNDDKHNWLELTILCVKSLIFGTIIIGAVLGNALVIISVQRNRKLRFLIMISVTGYKSESAFYNKHILVTAYRSI